MRSTAKTTINLLTVNKLTTEVKFFLNLTSVVKHMPLHKKYFKEIFPCRPMIIFGVFKQQVCLTVESFYKPLPTLHYLA